MTLLNKFYLFTIEEHLLMTYLNKIFINNTYIFSAILIEIIIILFCIKPLLFFYLNDIHKTLQDIPVLIIHK